MPAVTAVLAADECTFSESGMLQEVERVASAYPGATIYPKQLSASWIIGEGTIEFFAVGGCHDYGKTASRTTNSMEERNFDDVIRVALELGQKFMAVDVLELVSEAVEGDFDVLTESGGDEFVFVDHPFGQIVISHSFSKGVDTVIISWPVL